MSEHRKPCPSPDLLVALDEGVLPESLAAPVRDHLTTCRTCTVLRRDLRESSLAEPTLAETERVRQRVFGARPARFVTPARIGVATAAAAAVLFGVYFTRSASQPQPPAPAPLARESHPSQSPAAPVYRVSIDLAPLKLPFAAALVLRGQPANSSEPYLRELGAALDPYRAGQYADAARALAQLGRKYPDAVEPAFYEGVAKLLMQDAAGAASVLENARRIGGEALNDDIAWYLAAARERTQEWERAAALLRPLCQSDGVHREAACRALDSR